MRDSYKEGENKKKKEEKGKKKREKKKKKREKNGEHNLQAGQASSKNWAVNIGIM